MKKFFEETWFLWLVMVGMILLVGIITNGVNADNQQHKSNFIDCVNRITESSTSMQWCYDKFVNQ